MIKKIIKFSMALGASLVLMGGVASACCRPVYNPPPNPCAVQSCHPKKCNKCNTCNNKCQKPCNNTCGNTCGNSCGAGVTNTNTVGVLNASVQSASTGKALVKWNTTGGNATSGDATNDNTTMVDVAITNSNPAKDCGAICSPTPETLGDTTSQTSGNCNPCSVSVTNSNIVSVGNVSYQSVSTGSATVKGNTTGGDATSGDASNTNSTTVSVVLTNNN